VLEELADHAADRERDALGPGMPTWTPSRASKRNTPD
jgi:hypothetical protein